MMKQIIADAIISTSNSSSIIMQELKNLLQQSDADAKKFVDKFFASYSNFKLGEQVSH